MLWQRWILPTIQRNGVEPVDTLKALLAANSAKLRRLLHVCGCSLTYGRKKFSSMQIDTLL